MTTVAHTACDAASNTATLMNNECARMRTTSTIGSVNQLVRNNQGPSSRTVDGCLSPSRRRRGLRNNAPMASMARLLDAIGPPPQPKQPCCGGGSPGHGTPAPALASKQLPPLQANPPGQSPS